MFVSIHIPKTAGTALAKIFDDTSNRRVMYDYLPGRNLEQIRNCPDDIRAHKDFIKSYFTYLHGHFHYLRYADVFPDSPFIATVRDPVKRVISQFLHIRRAGDRNFKQHQAIMDGEMDIVEFSKLKFVGNAQHYYLEGRPIKDYDFIFVQEQLDESLQKFCAQFKLANVREYLGWIGGVPAVNEKPKSHSTSFLRKILKPTKAVEVTEDQKREIAKHCELDLEVFRLAKEALKAKPLE